MKIKSKITATFTHEENEIVCKVTHMFGDYDEDDWELLKQCFYDELYVDLENWFMELERIRDYIQLHS